MNRREFFSLTASGAVATHISVDTQASEDWETLADKLAEALERKHGHPWLVKADEEGEFILIRRA